MKLLRALIHRDLLLSWRQGGGAGTALGFFLTVVVLLPIGVGPDQGLLQRIAPGALWIALLLSVLLTADRIFQQDYEDGSLDVFAMGPVPLELVAVAKAAAHWLSTSLPLAIAAPLLGFLLNLAPEAIVPLALAMIVGSIALSMLAALGGRHYGGLAAGRVTGIADRSSALCPGAYLWRIGKRAERIRPRYCHTLIVDRGGAGAGKPGAGSDRRCCGIAGLSKVRFQD